MCSIIRRLSSRPHAAMRSSMRKTARGDKWRSATRPFVHLARLHDHNKLAGLALPRSSSASLLAGKTSRRRAFGIPRHGGSPLGRATRRPIRRHRCHPSEAVRSAAPTHLRRTRGARKCAGAVRSDPAHSDADYVPLVNRLDAVLDEVKSGEDVSSVLEKLVNLLRKLFVYPNWQLIQTGAHLARSPAQ